MKTSSIFVFKGSYEKLSDVVDPNAGDVVHLTSGEMYVFLPEGTWEELAPIEDEPEIEIDKDGYIIGLEVPEVHFENRCLNGLDPELKKEIASYITH